VWFRARPKLQVNRHMGNLVNVGHQEEKRMKIAIEGDLQRAARPEGKVAHLGLSLLPQLEPKGVPFMQVKTIRQGRGRHMLLKNGEGTQASKNKKGFSHLKPSRECLVISDYFTKEAAESTAAAALSTTAAAESTTAFTVESAAAAASSAFLPPQATKAAARPHTITKASTFFIVVYRF